MKSVDVNTVGGRIRASRQKSRLNLKQMAEKLEISPNYVSIVERNVKQPSDELLAKIAALTDTPFSWLKKGSDCYFKEPSEEDASPEISSSIWHTDIPLFLNLVLHGSPTISKETVTTVLNIDDDVLNDILDGNIEFDPIWEPGLLALVQRLDISDILKKLYNIESYLVYAEGKKMDSKIITALKKSLSEKFRDHFTYVSQQHSNSRRFTDLMELNRNTDTPVREYIFQQELKHRNWKIRMYSEMHGSQIGELLYRTRFHPYRPKDDDIIALVFSDESVFNELLDRHVSMPQFRVDGGPTTVILMRFDLDSMCVKEIIPADEIERKS